MKIKIMGAPHPKMMAGPKRLSYLFGMLCCLFLTTHSHAQEQKVVVVQDSVLPIDLLEVIVISSHKTALEHNSHTKPLSTLDEYLEASQKVNMIKRGAYA